MAVFGWYAADAVFSVVISLLIIWGSVRLIRESTNVLLEGTPAHINLAAVENAILDTSGVADVHDLHVWRVGSGKYACVLCLESTSGLTADAVREALAQHDELVHVTVEINPPRGEQRPPDTEFPR